MADDFGQFFNRTFNFFTANRKPNQTTQPVRMELRSSVSGDGTPQNDISFVKATANSSYAPELKFSDILQQLKKLGVDEQDSPIALTGSQEDFFKSVQQNMKVTDAGPDGYNVTMSDGEKLIVVAVTKTDAIGNAGDLNLNTTLIDLNSGEAPKTLLAKLDSGPINFGKEIYTSQPEQKSSPDKPTSTASTFSLSDFIQNTFKLGEKPETESAQARARRSSNEANPPKGLQWSDV